MMSRYRLEALNHDAPAAKGFVDVCYTVAGPKVKAETVTVLWSKPRVKPWRGREIWATGIERLFNADRLPLPRCAQWRN